MAVAVSYLAFALCELGHDVRGYMAQPGEPWKHPRIQWCTRTPLDQPEDFSADLIVSTISPVWRRTARAAERAGATGRTVYWHHHSEPPHGAGCILATPPAVKGSAGWARQIVLPPSSWAVEAGGTMTGGEILVPGASRAKGGHIALEVARACPDLRFFVLPGRSLPSERAPWAALPNATIAEGHIPPAVFFARARAVLSPTRAEVHPLTLVEAAVRGIPVVCSDLPGTRAAAPGAAFLPAAAAPATWATVLRLALQSPPAPLRLPPYRETVAAAIAELVAPRVAAPAAKAPAIVRARASSRPRVAILADVRTWAWARKSEQLRRHLSGEFDVEVAYLYDRKPDPIPKGCDLYHTFEVFQASKLPANHGLPYVTGMTAHVWKTWEERHGAGTVARWASTARAFHANSVLLRDEMAELLKRPIHYVPNGVDENFFKRTRPRRVTDRLVVGFQGKPNPRKGHALVVEACRLAGVELRDNVRTHRDALDAEGMREFYQDLHVLAVQSDMDGTPNSALEAAACGVAVVGNRIGNLPELIDGANGILVERSAESLAAALRSLTPARAVEMGISARRTIESAWTWRDLSANYARMWNEALVASDRKVA